MHLQFCAHDDRLQRSDLEQVLTEYTPRRTRISFCGSAIRCNIMMGIKKALEGEGDISGLLTVPQGSEVDGEDPAYSRAFETAGSGHDGVKGGKNSVVMDTLTSRQTAAAGLRVYRPQDGQEVYRAQSPSTFQSSPATDDRRTSRNRDRKGATTKTRFPSLAPAPGSFRSSGDVRAAEAVAHARKTWAPPALRTQAVTSYGAVPDLEIIPEDIEMQRFSRQHRARYIPSLGCPSCTIA